MRKMIKGLSAQLAWARDAVVEARVVSADEVLVCGMGGSGISGDVAAAVNPGTRIGVVKDYRLPAWAASARPLVAVVTYSGATEESLSALAEARSLGLDVVSLSSSGPLGDEQGHLSVPGGLQPRAAFGYLAGGLLRLLHGAGVIADPRPGIEEAGEVVDLLCGADLDGPGAELAADLATALDGRIPLVYGSAGLSGVAAYRWKTQVNENAKTPAFAGVLPEVDHNELAGWRGSDQERRLAIVHLRDREEDPRVDRRFQLTKELSLPPTVGQVWSQGTEALARLFSLTTVGDLTSLFLAEGADVDPVEVEVLTTLKHRMQEDA